MKNFGPRVAALALIVLFGAALLWLGSRPPADPARTAFADFPMRLDSWAGKRAQYDDAVIAALKVDDYLLANYTNYKSAGTRYVVNLYIAYYKKQALGSAAHSPRTCIPGDGWEIIDLRVVNIPLDSARMVGVNRVVISKGRTKQLVYYWFEQRGRKITNEYMVKWYILVDAITRNRTDGALIRLVTPVINNDLRAADKRLRNFLRKMYQRIPRYVPA